ncbi:Ig-like domain-containing protein [Kaarinaea lacus]
MNPSSSTFTTFICDRLNFQYLSRFSPVPGLQRCTLYALTRATVMLLLFVWIVGCGGGGAGDVTPTNDSPCASGSGPRTLCEIQLTPINPAIAVGTEIRLYATAIYSDQSKEDITEQVDWASSSSTIAPVSDTSGDKGVASGLATGVALISASLGTVQSSIQLAVSQEQLVAIKLSKQNIALPNGSQIDVQAFAYFSNNTVQDITAVATWSVEDGSVATVATEGVATIYGDSVGQTHLLVRYNGLAAETDLSITSAQLNAISIEPAQVLINAGTTTSLQALGFYSDGNILDITKQVAWQSSDINTVTVGSVAGDEGVLTGQREGSATVSATLNGISQNAEITVSNSVLNEITITPSITSIAKETVIQLTATGTYSDYSVRDITAMVTWISTNEDVVKIDNSHVGAGLLSALSEGEASIVAVMDDISVAVPLTITNAEVISINLVPSSTTMAEGSSKQLTATANFSDGSIQDVTELAFWTSSDTDVATVQYRKNGMGLVHANSAGSTEIIAAYKGKSASAKVDVSAAILTAIVIDSLDLSIARGTSASLTVTGHYSDGSTQDISAGIVWSSSAIQYVAVENGEDAAGNVHGLEVGSSVVSASAVVNPSISATITVTVTDAALESISVSPQDQSIPNNSSLQFSAVGHFSDGSTQDLTELVTWSSLSPELALASNAAGEKGVVFGVANEATGDGTAQIIASLDDGLRVVESTTNLTVTYEPLRPVRVTAVGQPNVIVNDGVDSTTIQTFVKASENGAVVANGTVVEYEIVSGSGMLGSLTATTTDGVANTTLTSNYDGLIVIKATIADTNISNFVAIVSTPSFSSVVTKFGFADYSYDSVNSTVQPGSVFTLYLFNLSNRNFSLDRYEFINGGMVLMTVDQFDSVNNQLKGGLIYGVALNVEPELQDNDIVAQFTLSDPITGQSFTVTHSYELTP